MLKIINCNARLYNCVKEFVENIYSCDNAVSAEKNNIQQLVVRGKHIQQLILINQQENFLKV